MKHNLIIHADDFGVNTEISDRILNCINNGHLNSTSVICNTPGFDYAMQLYKRNATRFRISLHINLVEGQSLCSKKEVSLLVDDRGEFRHSFGRLWSKYLFSNSSQKAELKRQVKMEVCAQIKKYLDRLGNGANVFIDSHRHMHVIPFVFETILEVSKEYKIEYIRMPLEKFHFSLLDFRNYLSSNVVKHFLLNFISKKNAKRIGDRIANKNDYFIGILGTGRMSVPGVQAALKTLSKSDRPKHIEILFHPGGVDDAGSVFWTSNQSFKDYYSSKERKKEASVLSSVDFAKVISFYSINDKHFS